MSQFAQFLDRAQREQILTQRVQQFAAEGYQHELNREVAVASGDTQSVESSDVAIAVIVAAIEVHQADLEALGGEA